MYKLFLIAIGGASGAILRFLVSNFVNSSYTSSFPFGTLIVNLIGCFLIGLFWAISERLGWPEPANIFLFVGLTGSFTTFSTYGLESLTLLQNGQILFGAAYIIVSNVIGIMAVLAGKVLIESI